jgi:hypothetical protein
MPSAVLATSIQDRVTNAKYYFLPAALQDIQKEDLVLTLATLPFRWQHLTIFISPITATSIISFTLRPL